MALLSYNPLQGSAGVKALDEASKGLIFENLQKGQYKYPIQSFIRETASNCVDSIKDKIDSLKIINGEIDAAEVYYDSEDEIYKDSHFDPSYYNPKYLNPINEVLIVYTVTGNKRDTISIIDTGVGLGGARLKCFMNLGYSTKRLNKNALGKYGLGSKSGLSTGVDSYTMISRYNGREYEFEIFNDIFVPTVNKFDGAGFETWEIETTEGKKDLEVYYRETSALNGVELKVEVINPNKNKDRFIDAVQQQLMYFPYIKFMEVDLECDYTTHHKVTSEILYQDDNIIIPKEDTIFSVCHLVLGGVSYGAIDFPEMEMDIKYGGIGIIGDANAVDVVPSRESIIYNTKTRNAILKYIEKAEESAAAILEKEVLTGTSDLEVLEFATSVGNEGALLGRVGKLTGFSRARYIVNLYGQRISIADILSNLKAIDYNEARGEKVNYRTLGTNLYHLMQDEDTTFVYSTTGTYVRPSLARYLYEQQGIQLVAIKYTGDNFLTHQFVAHLRESLEAILVEEVDDLIADQDAFAEYNKKEVVAKERKEKKEKEVKEDQGLSKEEYRLKYNIVPFMVRSSAYGSFRRKSNENVADYISRNAETHTIVVCTKATRGLADLLLELKPNTNETVESNILILQVAAANVTTFLKYEAVLIDDYFTTLNNKKEIEFGYMLKKEFKRATLKRHIIDPNSVLFEHLQVIDDDLLTATVTEFASVIGRPTAKDFIDTTELYKFLGVISNYQIAVLQKDTRTQQDIQTELGFEADGVSMDPYYTAKVLAFQRLDAAMGSLSPILSGTLGCSHDHLKQVVNEWMVLKKIPTFTEIYNEVKTELNLK